MDEQFMMGLFDKIKLTLPPFQEYYKHIYEEKALKLMTPSVRECRWCESGADKC